MATVSILRTSEAVGGPGLILLGDAVDPYDPATVRASMGSLFSQRFVRTSVSEARRWKDRQPYMLVGTAPSGSIDYQAIDYRRPTVLLMGGERKGLSGDLQALCDTTVRIPMIGHTDSLNLSVAASLLLYEVFNQRRHGTAGSAEHGDSVLCRYPVAPSPRRTARVAPRRTV